MKQYQRLTPKLFDKIVKEAIDRNFKIEYLKDQRLPDVFAETPEQKLKDEAYSIFFKSFDDILETIGIEKSKRKSLKIELWWWDTYHKIESWSIVYDNFPDIAPDLDYNNNDDAYDIKLHEILIFVFRKEFKNLNNVKIRFKDIHLSFWDYKSTKQYVISLEERIRAITDYILTRSIASQLLKASRGMRYKTEAERHHDGFYEMDMYSYVKFFAKDFSSTIKSLEKHIWQPEIRADNEKSWLMRVGRSGY